MRSDRAHFFETTLHQPLSIRFSEIHLDDGSLHFITFKTDTNSNSFNERDHLKERYVKFDPTALQRVAGRAIGEDRCAHIQKFAEGGFNKIFLLTAEGGREVIARIPTPIAGPPFYTTASEVAAIDFLRNVLQLPVPRTLGYSASPENPVGAEYIIMERT